MTAQAITEAIIRERLDGTFTRIGGVQEAVPHSFIPSHNPPYRHGIGEHLTEHEAREILQLYVCGTSQGVIAARYAVNISTVHNLVRRKTWKKSAVARSTIRRGICLTVPISHHRLEICVYPMFTITVHLQRHRDGSQIVEEFSQWLPHSPALLPR